MPFQTLRNWRRKKPSFKIVTKLKTKLPSTNIYSNIQRKLQHLANEWLTDGWGVELLSWTVSVLCLFAIFVVLESHRGKPLPEWPFSITVNSLVSVFSTGAQMAMMEPIVQCISQLKWLWFFQKPQRLTEFQNFDDASRGPTGSLILLGKLRGFHLVSLGAALTIISIAFGPISQQIVSFPLHLHAVGNASTPQILTLATENSTSNIAPLDDLTDTLNNGFSNGLSIANQSLSDVAPSCSTGNCTWSSYSSLGICTNTVDISSKIINNTCDMKVFVESFRANGYVDWELPCFNYTLPLFAQTSEIIPENGIVALVTEQGNPVLTDTPIFNSFNGLSSQFLSLSAGVYDDYSLVDMNVLYQPIYEIPFINGTIPPPVALQSSIQLCIQTYTTQVLDNNITTSLVSTKLLNATMILQSSENTTISHNGTIFVVNSAIIEDMRKYMILFLEDACYFEVSNNTLQLIRIFCGTSMGKAFMNGPMFLQKPIDVVTASIMENIAISMTNALRQRVVGALPVNQFQGIAYLPVTFVESNYKWFAFPIGLVTLTLILLLATIAKCRHYGMANWKSSNFPTLQALHPNTQKELGGLHNLTAMEKKVDETMVKLMDAKPEERKAGVGWRLVKTN